MRKLLAIRRRFAVLRLDSFYTERDIAWFDCEGTVPSWGGTDRTLGMLIRPSPDGAGNLGTSLCLLCNAGYAPAVFALPDMPQGSAWRGLVDTSRDAPDDIHAPGEERILSDPLRYAVASRSMAVPSARLMSLPARPAGRQTWFTREEGGPHGNG